jgi:hypothetical protein
MFGFLRRVFSRGGVTPNVSQQSIGFPMTPEMQRDAREDAQKILERLAIALNSSPVFRRDRLPELLERVRQDGASTDRCSLKRAYAGPTWLSAKEKSVLGLNTRMKYSHAFIDFFNPEALATIEPKSHLAVLHANVFWSVKRERQLKRLKDSGVGTRVNIYAFGEPQPCKFALQKKAYPIARAPALPFPGCDAELCSCTYEVDGSSIRA